MLALHPAEQPSKPREFTQSAGTSARSNAEVQSVASRKPAKPFAGGDRKQQRQSAILRDATREFTLLRRPEAVEVERYKELFYQLVDRLERNDRRLISAMLARSNFTPRPVALYFAQDALEVAAPFLLFSPVLNDLDLRAIAAKKGRLYADVIRKRKLPMEPFTERTLKEVDLANEQVASLVTSVENKQLDASSTGIGEENLRDAVLELASKGGRAGRREKSETSVQWSTTVPDSQDNAAHSPFDKIARATERFRLPKPAVRKLLSLGRQGRLPEMAEAIEEHCGLAAEDTLKILKGSKSDEPVYLIRALGISSPHDIQLAMLIQPAIGRSIEAYRATKKTLGELDQGICQIIFNEIGAQFELPRNPRPAVPVTDEVPASASKLNHAMQQRREAVQTRYQGDDRFAGGLSDRWPGTQTDSETVNLSMAG